MNLAIIPARGGSKRIPKKNIREFNGQPLISYSIQAALESQCFEKIVVSTDSVEIAEVAQSYGALIAFIRPDSLADDYTGTTPVVCHALSWFEAHGLIFEYVCCIYATAPFLQSQDIQQGLQLLQGQSEKEFAFSVTSFPYPVQRGFRITKENLVEPFQPECLPFRSQDLDEGYHDAGQYYWGTPAAFLEGKSIFSPVSIPVILPRCRVQDIDTLEDWEQAEYLHKVMTLRAKKNDENCDSR